MARRARAVDLTAIALTDHDTTDGVADAAHEAAKLGIRVIPGCEFSVRAPWGELHVLALFLPQQTERLEMFLRDTRTARRRRGEQIVAKLQGLGVSIELEDVQAQFGGGDNGALGRPHVARALVDCGACDNVSDAFRRYLHVQCCQAGDIAAWSIEAGHESDLNRIRSSHEHDRNRGSSRFCGQCRRRACGRCNHGHLTAHKIGHECGHSIVLPLGPAEGNFSTRTPADRH